MVGFSTDGQGIIHPFVWTQGTLQELAKPDGFAYCWAGAINRSGQVAGTCYPLTPGIPHAFLWSNGGAQDLNSLVSNHTNGTLAQAIAINDRGQIVVWTTSNPSFRPSRAVLLTPQ